RLATVNSSPRLRIGRNGESHSIVATAVRRGRGIGCTVRTWRQRFAEPPPDPDLTARFVPTAGHSYRCSGRPRVRSQRDILGGDGGCSSYRVIGLFGSLHVGRF